MQIKFQPIRVEPRVIHISETWVNSNRSKMILTIVAIRSGPCVIVIAATARHCSLWVVSYVLCSFLRKALFILQRKMNNFMKFEIPIRKMGCTDSLDCTILIINYWILFIISLKILFNRRGWLKLLKICKTINRNLNWVRSAENERWMLIRNGTNFTLHQILNKIANAMCVCCDKNGTTTVNACESETYQRFPFVYPLTNVSECRKPAQNFNAIHGRDVDTFSAATKLRWAASCQCHNNWGTN